jgi:hypothetical protein
MKSSALWLTSLLLIIFMQAIPAQAQATRTWVSGTGDDANPCSRTAPCKTFAGAISKTAVAGEINVIDPGGYGAVTITKSISIYNDTGEAGVLVTGTNGIIVNGAGVIVHLRGLVINGVGGSTGFSGIDFINGAQLEVENCVIQQMGIGITFASNGTNSTMHVHNTVLANNGTGFSIRPTNGFTASGSIENVQIVGNSGGALKVDGSGGGGAINVAVSDSVVSNNASNGVNAISGSGQSTSVSFTRTTIANNGLTGLQANNASGGTAGITIGSSVISQNATATTVIGSATIQSYGNNQVTGPLGSGFTSTGGLQ